MNHSNLEPLVRLATSLGATDVHILATQTIVADEHLAQRCIEPRCGNYGLSANCPPHVAGPPGFRELAGTHPCAVVVRIVVPSSALFSDSRGIFGLLHHIVAGVEHAAAGMGYDGSKAFAGGSCKDIFCRDHSGCNVLAGGECRHPDEARPSMSGFGIDVARLLKACGWPADITSGEGASDGESMSWVAGLVMIGMNGRPPAHP